MVFDSLLGNDSDESEDSEQQESQDSGSVYQHAADDPDWPYAYDEVDSIFIGDNEVISEGYDIEDPVRDDPEAYAGKWPRTIIGSRMTKPTDKTWLGYSDGSLKGLTPEGIRHEDLFKHAGIFGQTGVGKSTLLKNMMLQWIMAGYGVCFFDVHGDDSIDLLQSIPEERLDDVVWVEPAGEYDREVGFNFFEPSSEKGTIQYENEVEQIQSDFSELIDAKEGAKMGPITETIVRQLVKAEGDFTPIEFYKILQEEEERELMGEHFGDSFERPALEQLAEYDKEELDAIIRRIKSWVENKQTRQILARRESTVYIKDAIENNKIIIINLSNVNKDLQQIIGSTIIRRIWNSIKQRSNIPQRNRTPYYLVLDEFGRLEHPKMPINNILAEARKYKLSLTICTQHLEQIETDRFRQSVKDQVNTFLSFNPTNDATKARSVADTVGRNVNPHDLIELPDYHVAGRLYDENKDDFKTTLINSFPPFPPLRTEKEAKDEIRRSLERYGDTVQDEGKLDFEDYSLANHVHGDSDSGAPSSSNGKVIYTDNDGHKIYQEQLLESLHTAEIRYDTVKVDGKEWVTHEQLIDELEKYMKNNAGYASIISNGIEKISDKLIEQEQYSGETIYRLTAEGEEEVFVQDTGRGGSGGKQKHRRHLAEAYKIFTKLGYNVKLPTQGGNTEMPDGLAHPPIQPRDAKSREEQERLENKLQTEYPAVWSLFKDDVVSIESETTTPSRPAQALKNLSKAIEQGRKCAFIVPDGNVFKDDPDDEDKDIGAMANRLENIIKDPPCVKKINQDYKTYYNGDETLSLKDGTIPVYRSGDGNGHLVWKEDMNSGRIILTRSKREDSIAEFRNIEELKSPSGQKFEYRARQKNNGMWEVITGEDTNLDFVEEYNSKTELKKDWTLIDRPFIPREKFEQDLPPEHTWKMIIIPEAGRDLKEPQLYEDGELTPLYKSLSVETSRKEAAEDQESQELESFIDDRDLDDSDESNTQSESTSSTTEETTTDDEDQPKVSSEDKPKSTTDVVKESDEEWTKPEPGDDDYDPAKDNSNFRTGYDEDRTGENWTGGDARELDKEGDFENYTPPSQKEDEATQSRSQADETTQASSSPQSEEENTETDVPRELEEIPESLNEFMDKIETTVDGKMDSQSTQQRVRQKTVNKSSQTNEKTSEVSEKDEQKDEDQENTGNENSEDDEEVDEFVESLFDN